MAELPPDISILLLNGVFFWQFGVDAFKNCSSKRCRKKDYLPVTNNAEEEDSNSKSECGKDCCKKGCWKDGCKDKFASFFESKYIKIIASLVQIFSLAIFICVWSFHLMSPMVTDYEFEYLFQLRPMIALPICLLFLSLKWSTMFHKLMHKNNPKNANLNSQENETKPGKTARYKSCKLINYMHAHVDRHKYYVARPSYL